MGMSFEVPFQPNPFYELVALFIQQQILSVLSGKNFSLSDLRHLGREWCWDENPARNKAWEQMKTSLWYENFAVIIKYNKAVSKWLKTIKRTLREVCITVGVIGKWETMAVAQVWFCEWTLKTAGCKCVPDLLRLDKNLGTSAVDKSALAHVVR